MQQQQQQHSIYIRENSLEYNQPTLQPAKSETTLSSIFCCGRSPSSLAVRDRITTLYFDDLLMDNIRDDTRCCNPFMTFCCGGKGEGVQFESTFCHGMCYRGRSVDVDLADMFCLCCIPCVPVCCPEIVCPCAARVSTVYWSGVSLNNLMSSKDDVVERWWWQVKFSLFFLDLRCFSSSIITSSNRCNKSSLGNFINPNETKQYFLLTGLLNAEDRIRRGCRDSSEDHYEG